MHWNAATNTYTIGVKAEMWEKYLSDTSAMEEKLRAIPTLAQLIDLQILAVETMLNDIKSPTDCATLIPMLISFANSIRVVCWEKKGEIINNPSEFDNSNPGELYANLLNITRWMTAGYRIGAGNPATIFAIHEKVFKDLVTLSNLIAYHPRFTIIVLQPKET